MAKSISDFEKYAASLSEIINPEIRAEYEGLYKDNSATIQFFKRVDKYVQEILSNSAIGSDDLDTLKNVLPILEGLKNGIATFASKKRSKVLDKEITQLISEIEDKMPINEVEGKNKQFFELLNKNKQALKVEFLQQPPEELTDNFLNELKKKIKQKEDAIKDGEPWINEYKGKIRDAEASQKETVRNYREAGFSIDSAFNNSTYKMYSDEISRCHQRIGELNNSRMKLSTEIKELEDKQYELNSLGRTVEERLEKYYRDLLNKKNTPSNNEEDFKKLAEDFRKLEEYFEDAEESAKECEDMPRKMHYNRLLRAQILAKTEQEFREIAKESRSLSMKFKDKEFLELAKECTNRADKIAEQEKKNKYNKLIQEYKRASTEKDFSYLEAEFRSMNGYENTAELAKECANQHRALKERREKQETLDEYNRLVQAKKNASTEEEFQDLVIQFRAMIGYENTAELANECDNQYRALKEQRIAQEKCRLQERRQELKKYDACISSGTEHTVGLKTDGTVVTIGNNEYGQCNTNGWRNIVAVFAHGWDTIGLKANGKLISVGRDSRNKCNFNDWMDIVTISAGSYHIVGLKTDGTAVAVGENKDGQCNVGGWSDIVAISAGACYTVGLKTDGTVVAVGRNEDGQCNVGGWRDIVAISAGAYYTVGLKMDGTAVAVGANKDGQCNVGSWRDIVAISAGKQHTIGLKMNGRVIAVGSDETTGSWNPYAKCREKIYTGQCNVNAWQDIVAVFAGSYCTLGLKANGKVVTVGKNTILANNTTYDTYIQGCQLNTNNWRDIGPVSEELRRRMQGLCIYCGGKVVGLFTKKCKVCGKPR